MGIEQDAWEEGVAFALTFFAEKRRRGVDPYSDDAILELTKTSPPFEYATRSLAAEWFGGIVSVLKEIRPKNEQDCDVMGRTRDQDAPGSD
jgi:hypothetical protein